MVKKFDILVHDQDHNVPPKREVGVMAESAKSLEAMYRMCGQNIEILKTYSDDDCEKYGTFTVNMGDQCGPMGTGALGGGTGFLKVDNKAMENLAKVKTASITPMPEAVVSPTGKPPPTSRPPIVAKPVEPTKYFQVGGIKCKMENGKLYQKQWMRLVDSEADEIRIVSDRNNRICPLKDKHIEVLKWVAVEDDGKDASDGSDNGHGKCLELING